MPVRLSEQRRKAIARSLVKAASSADSFSISSIDQLLFRVGACRSHPHLLEVPALASTDPPVSRFVLPFLSLLSRLHAGAIRLLEFIAESPSMHASREAKGL